MLKEKKKRQFDIMGNTIGDCLILIVTETITIREVMGTTIHMQFTIERDW